MTTSCMVRLIEAQQVDPRQLQDATLLGPASFSNCCRADMAGIREDSHSETHAAVHPLSPAAGVHAICNHVRQPHVSRNGTTCTQQYPLQHIILQHT
jgi:hypothetical protein